MRTSKWLYALVAIAVLNVGWSLVGSAFGGGLFDANVAVMFAYLVGGLLGLLLTPVFFVALYRDASVVRRSSSPWNPDRWLWVGGGVLWSLVAYLLARNPAIAVVAVPYLVRRYRNPASPEADDRDRSQL